MGLFTASPTPSTDGAPSPSPSPSTSTTTSTPPTRATRTLCYTARDNFFACLDTHHIIDPIKDQQKADTFCAAEGKEMERECVGSWVTYFKQRRVMEFSKKATLEKLAREGAEEVGAVGGGMGKGQRPEGTCE